MNKEKIEKDRLTLHLSKDLIERAKNAVYWTPGLTLTELGETALSEYLNWIEQKRGKPFPPREGKLTTGRPMN